MPEILYTGKGLTPEFKSDGGQVMSRLSDFITKAEEIKYQAFKDNKDWFLKTQEVDPIAFITTANQDTQNRLMKEYNESSAAIVKRAGGFDKLSGEAQAKILAGKNYLVSEQNKMAADQEQYLLEKNMITKDADTNYSSQEFYETKEVPYLNGESYNRTPIQPKAQSISSELMGLQGKFGSTTSRNIPSKGAPGFFDTLETTGTRDDIAPYIVNRVFENPKYKRDMLERWAALSQDKKDEYLDTDKSGTVDEVERVAGTSPTRDKENPILRFYIDQNWQSAVKEEPSGKPTRIKTGSASKQGGKTIRWGDKDVVAPIGRLRQGAINYGGEIRPSLYSFGGTFTIADIPTEGGYYIYDTDKEAMEGGYNVSGVLLDYDKDNDTLIMRATTASSTIGVGTKQLVEVQASKVENVDSLPIVVNGKQTTLGELRGDNKSLRADGTKKGNGFLGVLKRPDGGVSTELSIGVNIGGKEIEIPTLIPTLTKEEKKYLLATPPNKMFTANPFIFKGIKEKAIKHAQDRINKGLSPFASNWDNFKR